MSSLCSKFVSGFWIYCCIFIHCVAILLLSLGTAHSERSKAPGVELAELKVKIEKEEERLQNIKGFLAKSVIQLKEVEQAKEVAELESRDLSKLLKGIASEQSKLKQGIEKAEADSSLQREYFKTRIVAIYKMHRRTSLLDFLFKAESTTDLLRRAYFLSVIARDDRKNLDSLIELLDKLQQDKLHLSQIKKEKEQTLEKLDALQKMLAEKRTLKASLLRQEREKLALQEDSIKKMRKSAQKLEKMLARLTGSQDKSAPVITSRQLKSEKGVDSSGGLFQGGGLRKRKGRLRFPVVGKLLQKYGKQKHEEFADMLFIKGIEVASPEGTLVRSIEDSVVLFVGSLPGYGRVLILDHGKRYYSLYGRISESSREIGEQVSEGDVIAVVGPADKKKRNFYFELRHKGKAINPNSYFAKLPKSVPN